MARPRSVRARRLLPLLLLGLSAAAPRDALGQSAEDLTRARESFRQGLSLEAAGNWASALAKFQEVARVRLTPQVRYHTARCAEQLGRLTEALGEYRLAEHEATEQGLAEVAEIAEARRALEARIPKLLIRRGAGAESARIELDGVELGEAQIGTAVQVDPGPHRVVVRVAPDRTRELTATLRERETTELVAELPADAGAAPAPAAPAAPAAGEPNRSGGSVVPWIIGGVGVAGLAAGGVFYLLRSGAESELEDVCRGDVCPRSVKDTQESGELYTTLTMVSLGVGVVGVGTAAVLLATGGDEPPERASAAPRVSVAAVPGAGFVSVAGRF